MKKFFIAFISLVGIVLAFEYGSYESGTRYAVPVKKADKSLTENLGAILENQQILLENQKAILKNQKAIYNAMQLVATRLQLPMP